MTYPKMLYRSDAQFPDEDSLKAAISPGGGVRNCVVNDEEAEAAAVDAGWTDSPMDFIGVADAPKRGGRKAKTEEPGT